jgi:hypothetical protein
MAEQNPSLHIDNDWKKQAQEEKRKLAEAEKAKSAASAPATTAGGSDASATAGAAREGASPRSATAPGAARGQREMPPATFATLVQSIVTQALFYLGDLAPRGQEPTVNLDMAKHQIDLLGVLEEKSANNLGADEQKMLDAALYEARMRYINVASQFLGP